LYLIGDCGRNQIDEKLNRGVIKMLPGLLRYLVNYLGELVLVDVVIIIEFGLPKYLPQILAIAIRV
jgi:hypothetical protein